MLVILPLGCKKEAEDSAVKENTSTSKPVEKNDNTTKDSTTQDNITNDNNTSDNQVVEKLYKPKNRYELKELLKDETIKLDTIDVSLIKNLSYIFKGTNRKDFNGIESWNVPQTVLQYNTFKGTPIEKNPPSWYYDNPPKILYTPEDKTIEYGDEFDKLNFVFTLPTQVTVNGELKIQFIAYLCDGSETLVPFKMLKLKVNEAINYAKQLSVENPDLIVKAYEYSNLAMESAKAAENSASESAASALSAQQDATKAEQYAKTCETKANEAVSSAQSSLELVEESSELTSQAQESASQAQQSAEQAQQSASEAAQDAEIANNNSQTALSNSNDAVNTSNKALEIVDNLTVSKEVVDCEQDPNVIIETNNTTKHKNLKFTLPEPKKGTSYRNRGAWNSGTEYINDEYYIDTVSRYGCTYYCKVTNTNQTPTDSADNDYWGLLALKGNDAGITIIDNLTSDHADYALSANQGRILKDLIASSIESAINQIIDNAPDSLNTLKKIAQAINNDANFSTTIKNLISQNSTDISNIISGTSIVGKSKYLSEYDTRNVNSTPEEYFNSSFILKLSVHNMSVNSLKRLLL